MPRIVIDNIFLTLPNGNIKCIVKTARNGAKIVLSDIILSAIFQPTTPTGLTTFFVWLFNVVLLPE